MVRILFVLVLLALPSLSQAEQGAPIELAGSRKIETWLNKKADDLGMVRIKDDKELERLINIGYLVPIPDSICVDRRLENKWRYVMPQVADFLVQLQEEFSMVFGEACFILNSAVRNIPRQLEITRGTGTRKNGNAMPNLNAAGVTGEGRSLHLTGATIDLGKLDPSWLKKDKMVQLRPKIINWLRENLLKFEDGDSFDVTEEFGQAVFHITILPKEPVTVN